MSKNLGGWIHTFAITETNTHKKGYTIYKITSIVFPRSVPEALTCVTVWKRFHDIKRLYKELSKRHKQLQLRGTVPEIKNLTFFNRFDPDVIKSRKQYILELLDFAAQHPALYKSHAFLNFFENGYTPNNSPLHCLQKIKKGNIENICDNIDLTVDSEISLIDPNKDKIDETDSLGTGNIEIEGSKVDKVTEEIDSDAASIENRKIITTEKSDDSQSTVIKTSKENTGEELYKLLTPQISFEDGDDYIYEAAFEFSKAVQAEVNHEYQESYDRYKCGIEKLLSGWKDDSDEERRFIAKAKVSKYLARAEEIYEKHLLNKSDKKKIVQLSVDSNSDPDEILNLERPWNQLSKFKVIQIVDTVMKVHDVTDKSVYIMKAIEKPSTNSSAQSIFLPQGVPYMVELLGFFQSDTAIYLLLEQAKGGKLYDYIRNYKPPKPKDSKSATSTSNLNDIFIPIEDKNSCVDLFEGDNISSKEHAIKFARFDSKFVELLKEYQNESDKLSQNSETSKSVDSKYSGQEQTDIIDNVDDEKHIPHFEVLSQNMDVNDLVNCSQKLLQSVSNTLLNVKEKTSFKATQSLKDKEQTNSGECAIKRDKIPKEKFLGSCINKNTFPEATIMQWARELLTAIANLHEKGVILGDLNSKNILLGSKGQLLVSYFCQNEGSGSNLQLLIDTHALNGLYVAPERPLTIKSDWWSFGVILFELLTGYTFKSCHPSGFSSYFEIQYPPVTVSDTAKDLLQSLLNTCPSERYNCEQIKNHSFFKGTNWKSVIKSGLNSH